MPGKNACGRAALREKINPADGRAGRKKRKPADGTASKKR